MSRVALPLGLAASAIAAAGGLAWRLATMSSGDGGADAGGPAVVGKAGSLATSHPDEISVVSYNVLADCFAEKLSEYADDAALDWEGARWPAIKRQLTAWQADVVCLQEVDVVWLQRWAEFAEAAGYELATQDTKGKQVVCAILYRRARGLRLGWLDASRSRTLLASFLFHDSSGALQALFMANAHLEGSPRRAAERVRQARSALASLERHQLSLGLPPADCHVVFAGDLNSGRREAVVRLLTEGWLPAGYREPHMQRCGGPPAVPEGGEDATQPFLLADAYERRPLPFTRKVPALESSLDWLLATTTLTVAALLWPLDPADPADRRLPHSRAGLPNARHPSDHLSIGATLRCLPAGVLAPQHG